MGEARRLYEEGLRHYNIADYDVAIDRFKRAYALSNAPELLFNLAQAYRLKGPAHCGEALTFYESYLRVAPNTPKRASVEAASSDMLRCVDERQHVATPAPSRPERERADEPVPTAATPAPAQPASPSLLPLVLGVAAGVVAASGGALLVWSRARYEVLEDRCAPRCDSELVDPPRTAQTVGLVALGAGAIAAATAIVLWRTERATVRAAPSAMGARLDVRF